MHASFPAVEEPCLPACLPACVHPAARRPCVAAVRAWARSSSDQNLRNESRSRHAMKRRHRAVSSQPSRSAAAGLLPCLRRPHRSALSAPVRPQGAAEARVAPERTAEPRRALRSASSI